MLIGIASYRNADKLAAAIKSVQQHSVGEWRLCIVHNPSHGDDDARMVIDKAVASDHRITSHLMPSNAGYSGAVNYLLACAEQSEETVVGYLDNDVQINSHGWNQLLQSILEQHSDVGIVFPGLGHKPLFEKKYAECFWNAGFCWCLRVSAINALRMIPSDWARFYYGKNQQIPVEVPYDPKTGWCGPYRCNGYFDPVIGHHEEVDYQIRLRLAGYSIANCPGVNVIHHESTTRSAESETRIHDGVVRWMNKWNAYFVGGHADQTKALRCERGTDTSYGEYMIQMDAWNVSGPYLNRFYAPHLPGLNANPEIRNIPNNGPVDLIRIPRPMQFYRKYLI